MERRKKLLLAVVVMAIGVAVALLFRKSEIIKSHSGPVWNSDSGAATAGNNPAPVTPQVRPTSPDVTAFDGHIEAAPGSAAGGTSYADHLAGADEANGSNATRTGPLVDMNAPEQKHIIIDGDTLQSLAQQYLGRADRYWELFQYNRDVLRNPDVLPIGAELRIPSQVAIPPASGAAALPSAPTVPLSPLVPLPAMPNAPAQPMGKTALPVKSQNTAGAQRAAPRTYTVQPGDNLIDIARKFYGDGRRYEDLYEANRRVMHNPTDLKPGMVLNVP